ncbi:hypothetical protein BKA67DRAFT_541713 [Truncatella angustata]|uniref:Uncharacterized protein n=1 Tax=Truncatella angustata TaxID=152316 RepID=A0A9P8RLH4_9PEZI|nr:uncharacterized protein BKA67DRAFT_541713 [Truncatella angustata]KAH6645495.1 hypothetical protein BKA67DRAFT_541713 [Truncatella angustata]KAH8193922.1 hypothetical protein TruAng_011910 [Truncatella angustata]
MLNTNNLSNRIPKKQYPTIHSANMTSPLNTSAQSTASEAPVLESADVTPEDFFHGKTIVEIHDEYKDLCNGLTEKFTERISSTQDDKETVYLLALNKTIMWLMDELSSALIKATFEDQCLTFDDLPRDSQKKLQEAYAKVSQHRRDLEEDEQLRAQKIEERPANLNSEKEQ